MIKNKNIDGGRGFDWGLASADYATILDLKKRDDIYEPYRHTGNQD